MKLETRMATGYWKAALANAANMIEQGRSIEDANAVLESDRAAITDFDRRLLAEMAEMEFERGNLVHGMLEELLAA